jgi:hypothetical protein
MLLRQVLCAAGHLRRLFADLGGVDDEYKPVRILVLLHQLQYGLASVNCRLPAAVRLNSRSRLFTFGIAELEDGIELRVVAAGHYFESRVLRVARHI